MIPPVSARDAGLFNAVLNVYFDPLTAKRRSFKDGGGWGSRKEKNRDRKENVFFSPISEQNVLNMKFGASTVLGVRGCA